MHAMYFDPVSPTPSKFPRCILYLLPTSRPAFQQPPCLCAARVLLHVRTSAGAPLTNQGPHAKDHRLSLPQTPSIVNSSQLGVVAREPLSSSRWNVV